MTYRVRKIGIAGGLAIVAALLNNLYVTNYQRQVQRGEGQVTVLVAQPAHPGRQAGLAGTRQQADRGRRRQLLDDPPVDRQPGAEVRADPRRDDGQPERRNLAPRDPAGGARRRQLGPSRRHLHGPDRRSPAWSVEAVLWRSTMTIEATNDSLSRDTVRVFVTGLCDGLPDLREALAKHPEIELVGWSDNVLEGASTLTGGHLQVVLHATRSATLPANDVAAIREYTRAPVILLASGGSPTLLEDALDADIADVLLLPQLTDNVVFSIKKACHAGRRQQAAAGGRQGRLVTVFSPKGGTGKTVLSTNVSSSLAKHWGKRALLLDLDLQFGDAAIMLGLEPEKTIYDLVTAPGELDSEKLAGYTTRHACGLDILPAPLRPEDAELVTEPKLARLLEVARESYDVTVVDTSPFFHGPMLATLDRTDELLLLTSLDVPTIKNVRLSLQTLELLSFPSDRIRVVLNRANSKVGMQRKEVESALEMGVRHEVPSDRAVPLAVNRGNPAVLSDSKSEFSRSVRELAKSLVTAQAVAKERKKFLTALART